jgi:hypothetical protein
VKAYPKVNAATHPDEVLKDLETVAPARG